MFKVGDRVSTEIRGEILYGVVVDAFNAVVSIAVGETRVVQSRECDVSYDEGYSRLKQERIT